MRALIIGTMLFLAACNGDKTVTVPYSDPALVAQVDSLTKALADATHVQAAQAGGLGKIQLVGKVDTSSSSGFRTVQSVPVDFGPCADMGVLEGTSFSSGTGPLSATFQAFKNCLGVHAEYEVETGNLRKAIRVYFPTPDCSGTAYVWQASGQGYNIQTLTDGVAFISPASNEALFVPPNQTPTTITAQSVFILANGTCDPDGDVQPMWATIANVTAESGIPVSVGIYHLASP